MSQKIEKISQFVLMLKIGGKSIFSNFVAFSNFLNFSGAVCSAHQGLQKQWKNTSVIRLSSNNMSVLELKAIRVQVG